MTIKSRGCDYGRESIPFDFPEVVAALAPCAFLAISPVNDSNFKWRSAARVVEAARAVYRLHGETKKLGVMHPNCAHDFPTEQRESAYRWLEKFVPQE